MQTWTDDQIKASLRKGGYHRERALEYMFKAWFNALRDEARTGAEDAATFTSSIPRLSTRRSQLFYSIQ